MAKITTVRDLIAQLEAIENKDLDVVMDYEGNNVLTDVEAFVTNRYYGKSDDHGWTACTRECVVLVGWE